MVLYKFPFFLLLLLVNSHSLFYADQGEKKKTVMQKWIQ